MSRAPREQRRALVGLVVFGVLLAAEAVLLVVAIVLAVLGRPALALGALAGTLACHVALGPAQRMSDRRIRAFEDVVRRRWGISGTEGP